MSSMISKFYSFSTEQTHTESINFDTHIQSTYTTVVHLAIWSVFVLDDCNLVNYITTLRIIHKFISIRSLAIVTITNIKYRFIKCLKLKIQFKWFHKALSQYLSYNSSGGIPYEVMQKANCVYMNTSGVEPKCSWGGGRGEGGY